MSDLASEHTARVVDRRARPTWLARRGHPELRGDENASVQGGAWMGELSDPLHAAILAVAAVRRVEGGTCLARRGDAPSRWIGVASGAVRLGTALSDGRNLTLEFVAPGQWFGDIALIDERPLDVDVVAHVPSTLLVVSKADLRTLVEGFDELSSALLRLNCQRLRHMLRRFEEQQVLPLAQRLARQLQRLARQFGRVASDGVSIELALSQGDLAAMVGGSRQRVNAALRQMHDQGVLRLGLPRLRVLNQLHLADLAEGRCLCTQGLAGAA
jgi:CRP/FNR family cyclic AMP-dependent transcriptional regulator